MTIPTIFTAVDKYSSVLNTMQSKTEKFAATAMNVAKKSFLIGGLIAAPLALAANEAIKFEDKIADVAKVANVDFGSKQFEQLGESAKKLSMTLAIMPEDAAALMANLAQGGVAIEDLDRVATIAGKVGVAFGISGDMAGEMFVKTKNALGATIEGTEKLMDSINFLGNTTAAASPQILTFMSAGGSGVARALGASGETLAGVGATFISMGKSAEESATVMERFTKATLSQAPLRKIFDSVGGGSAGMMKVIEEGAKKSGKAQDAYFRQFGQYGITLQLLAKNFDQLQKNVDASTNSTLTANSAQIEFENRQKTTATQIAKARAEISVMAIEIGNALIPTIRDAVSLFSSMAQGFSEFSKENPKTVATIAKLTAGVAALALVIGGVATVASWLASAFGAISATVVYLTPLFVNYLIPALQVVGAAFVGILEIAAAFVGLSFGAFIAALVAIGGIVYSIYNNWQQLVNAFKTGGMIEGLKMIGAVLLDAILLPLQKLFELLGDPMGWASSIKDLRAEMGLNVSGGVDATNTKAASQIAMQEYMSTNNAKVDIDINDPNGRTNARSNSDLVSINMGSTMAFGFE